jgi:predicted enzyme related to lactoylglutathione lyase
MLNAMSALKNPVGWFEIHVADMERACNFYEFVFNQKLTALPSGDPSIKIMAFTGDMNSHGANGALVLHPMKTPSTEGALIYFSCNDCSVQEKLALGKGGQVFKSKFSIGPNGFISIIGDSEGNAIGLHSFV